nr:retrovirus-related Pol polyprotein from transposon TNT 1-94 [Tanacetum cinerariifolium]
MAITESGNDLKKRIVTDLFLPNTFWAEAVSTACYVLNRVLVSKPQNKTPYELLTGKGPTWLFDLDHLTDSMNYQPVTLENKANRTASPKEANNRAVKCSTTKNGDEKHNEDIGAARASSTNYVNTVSTPVNTASITVKTTSLSRNINVVGPSSPDLLTYDNQDDS